MYRFLGKKEPLKIYKTQSKSLQKISAVASHLPKLLLTNQVQKTIDALNKNVVKNKYKLKNLRTICSTGSPLSKESFEYIYKNIKKNVHLSSISGGTDIVSCFVLGNLYEPVISGEIQNKGLGMNVKIFNEKGNFIKNKKGELVCVNPFPSMPLKFWNDKKDEKFNANVFVNVGPVSVLPAPPAADANDGVGGII